MVNSVDIPLHIQSNIKDALAHLVHKHNLPIVLDLLAEVCKDEAHFQGKLHSQPDQKIADHWFMAATQIGLVSDGLR